MNLSRVLGKNFEIFSKIFSMTKTAKDVKLLNSSRHPGGERAKRLALQPAPFFRELEERFLVALDPHAWSIALHIEARDAVENLIFNFAVVGYGQIKSGHRGNSSFPFMALLYHKRVLLSRGFGKKIGNFLNIF